MLKSNIKIILSGLFLIVLLGLAYSMFRGTPEIISDESMRVEEPELPGMLGNQPKLVTLGESTTDTLSTSQIESSLESKLIDQPVASYRSDLKAERKEPEGFEVIAEYGAVKSSAEAKVVTESPFKSDAIKRFETDDKPVAALEALQDFEIEQANSNESIAIEAQEERVKGEAAILADSQVPEEKSDVAIIADDSDFIDLNLVEAEPATEAVLVEGDQLILDDINQTLISSDLNEDAGIKEADSTVVVADESSKVSVFTLPEVDQDLMQGDNEISQQYRQTMTKLISINAKLRAADEENEYLQNQFDMAVANNRQLAQIIRDIDIQIKSFTSTN